MRLFIKRAIPVCLAVGAAIVIGQLGFSWFAPVQDAAIAGSAPKFLVVEPESSDFGEVWASNRLEHNLKITNISHNPVTLESFQGDCSCMVSSDVWPMRFGAGETRTINLNLDLTRVIPSNDLQVVPYQLKLTGAVESEGARSPIRWELTGRIKPAIHIDPQQIQIGIQSINKANIEKSISVDVADNIVRLECDGRANWFGKVRTDPTPGSSRRYLVSLTPRPKQTPRIISDKVGIYAIDRSGRRVSSQEVSIGGEFVSDVMPVPRTIQHGRQKLNETLEETFRLETLTGTAFKVLRFAITTPNLTITPVPNRPNYYISKLVCNQLGEHASSVIFTIEQNGEEYTIAILISYDAVAVN